VVWFDVASPDPILTLVRVETTVRAMYQREAGARRRAFGFKFGDQLTLPLRWALFALGVRHIR